MRRHGLFLIGIAVAIVGCRGPRALTESELDDIRAHRKALVVMQFKGTLDGRPFDPLEGWHLGTQMQVNMLKLDQPATPPLNSLYPFYRAPGSDTTWAYAVVEPGNYWMGLANGAGMEEPLKYWYQGDGPLRVEVPRDTPLVYAGSIDIQYTAQHFLFGEMALEPLKPGTRRIADAHDEAATVVAGFAPGIAPIQTILVEPYTAPIHVTGKTPRLWTGSLATLQKPNLGSVAVENFASPGTSLVAVGASGGGGSGEAGAAAILFGGALAIGGGAVGALVGSTESAIWEPRFKQISAEIATMNPPELLRQKLSQGTIAADEPAGIGPQRSQPPKATDTPLLQVWIEAIQIAPAHGNWGGNFTLQLWTRARLWDPATQRWRGDRLYVFTHASTRHTLPACAILVDSKVEPFTLEQIKPPEGLSRIRDEVTHAVNDTAERIKRDFIAAP